MACERGGDEVPFRDQAPNSHDLIFAGSQEKARVARPRDVGYFAMMACIRPMPDKGSKLQSLVRGRFRRLGGVPYFDQTPYTNSYILTCG